MRSSTSGSAAFALASVGRERERPVAEREHHVLGAPDEVRVLVVEDEVRRDPPRAAASRRAPARASRPSSGACCTTPASVRISETPGLYLRFVERTSGARLRCDQASSSANVGQSAGQEVRLGLRAQHGLAEVVGELLVRADRVVGWPVDRDLLGLEAQVDRGGVDDQGAEAVADHGEGRVPGGGCRHGGDPCGRRGRGQLPKRSDFGSVGRRGVECPRADHAEERPKARRCRPVGWLVTLKPSVMVLMVCALGCAGHLHAIPTPPGLAAARDRVDAVRSDLAPRWRCDTATRRALLTDDDAERLYQDVQAACPAARDPLAPG